MKKEKKIHLDFVIDKLTNSIQNTISGDSFATEVSRLTKVDIKEVTKKTDGTLIENKNLITTHEKYIN